MRNLLTVLFLAFVFGCGAEPPSESQSPRRIAITQVTVVDVVNERLDSDMTVIINGDRIEAIDRTEESPLPVDADVVDGTGGFLIPGLWDMHVHLAQTDLPYRQEVLLPLLVANGVTGVRDLGGDIDELTKWREQIRRGELLGPRLVISGPMLDGPEPLWPSSLGVATEAEAREAVKLLAQAGADFIKVQSLIPRDAYLAVSDEAKNQGLPLVGHVPLEISTSDAIQAGQYGIEHMDDLAWDLSEKASELKATMIRFMAEGEWPNAAFLQLQQEAYATFDRALATDLYEELSANGVWLCPTLGVTRVYAFPQDPRLAADHRLRYLPPSWKEEHWAPAISSASQGLGPEHATMAQDTMQNHRRIVSELHEAGGGILAGTDTPSVPHMIPGFSLHDELVELVEAGLSPAAALRTATVNPAAYLGAEDSFGTVATGRLADLVLLEANPLEDIRNTQRIRAVVLQGKVLDRAMLDALLAGVETLAATPEH